MKIFITGATGIIGYAVATKLAAQGHQVFGMVRSEAKGKRLAQAEVHPIISSMDDPTSYLPIANTCQVLIHCAAEYTEQYQKLDRLTLNTFLQSARDAHLPRKVIYTSGVWVFGNTAHRVVDESSPLQPMAFTEARIESEKIILNAQQGLVSTLCIRPGCVYGGSGSLTSAWFQSALSDGAATIIGDGSNRWAMVHVQDLADAYTRMVETEIGGHIFNVTDRSRFTILECAEAVNRVTKKGPQVKTLSREEGAKIMGPLVDGLLLNQHVDSSKATRVLGWQPRHGGFVDGIDQYFAAWRAANSIA